MRLEILGQRPSEAGAEPGREVGAAVVRAKRGGGIAIELGPADGPPAVRVTMTGEDARRLIASLESVTKGNEEEVMLADQ